MALPGILGQLDCSAAANNLVATVSASGNGGVVNVCLVNRTNATVNVSLAIVPNGTASPANQHWIEYMTPLAANQPLERGGLALGPGDKVFVYPQASGVSCSVVGVPL